MFVRYLNLEYWFYQIYLLLNAIFNFIATGSFTGDSSGYAIDPVTGYLIDPITHYLINPATGFVYDPVTGVLIGFKLLPLVLLKLSFLFFSLFFFIWLIYSWRKTEAIRKKEKADMLAGFASAVKPEDEASQEWQDILDHVDSDIEAQWKLALIDADKILEGLLRKGGYAGEGIGEMLKNAEAHGGFKTIQDAWEAHKVRNRIAHESGFVLTKREAKRAVELYRNVFQDLHFL